MDVMINKLNKLKKDWVAFRSNPEYQKIRIRDAAKKLSVSEAELLSTQIGDGSTLYLKISDIDAFLIDVLDLDKLMLLVRNDTVVHEKNIHATGLRLKNAKILYPDGSDLLAYIKDAVCHVFYESKEHAGKELLSFQIFDDLGEALIKIYLKGRDHLKFKDIALRYSTEYQYELQNIGSNNIDDTINSTNYLRLSMPWDQDRKILNNDVLIQKSILRELLEYVAKQKIPVQIHALGNRAIQYHRDIISNIVDYGPWINIIDKSFNIHVLESSLVSTRVSEYVIGDNRRYSFEFFNEEGRHLMGLAQLNGNYNFDDLVNELGVFS